MLYMIIHIVMLYIVIMMSIILSMGPILYYIPLYVHADRLNINLVYIYINQWHKATPQLFNRM